jgi:hypothetical protein
MVVVHGCSEAINRSLRHLIGGDGLHACGS